jgi:hypothetical protein
MLKSIAQARRDFKPNTRSDVVKIPGTNTYTNSVNTLIANQGGGKTFQSMNEAMTIARTLPQTHLIVLFAKKEYDETVQGTMQLSPVPIKVIAYDEAQDFMEKLIAAKHF